ncbi:MAG: efflux RND transporter periplasmic adaptor subunit [Isosphaeraceae bacterium]
MIRRFLFLGCSSALFLAAAGGCQANKPKVAPAEPPVVPVSRPVEREVTDYVDFTGRTEAVHSVDIRPRVSGYLVEMPFEEGAEVKKGDLLFVVDPRPYQAQVDQAQGQVDLYQASLKLAKTTLARDRAINALSRGSISQQQFDQEQATVDEAQARVDAYKKSMELYVINHEWTRVLAPIDGQISRYYLTLGNLVDQNQTLLTTIVSVNPMYAYFEMDEPTLLRIRRVANEGRIKTEKNRPKMPVLMGLQGEEGYPHVGQINFFNNQVNPTTGSILVRGVFPNPAPKGGQRLLSPGMFVRIRLPLGEPHHAHLVIDRAVASDQDKKFVYVLDAENKVQYRRVTIGALQEDGLRVIREGLKGDESVIVGALQQIRPRMEVKPEPVPMPTLGPPPGETPTESRKSASPAPESRKSATSPSELGKSAPSPIEPGKAPAPWTGPPRSAFPPPDARKPSPSEPGKSSFPTPEPLKSSQSEPGKPASSPAETTQR